MIGQSVFFSGVVKYWYPESAVTLTGSKNRIARRGLPYLYMMQVLHAIAPC